MLIVGEGLRSPRVAFARRLRRNYIYVFLILLAAWILKISTPSLQDQGPRGDFVHSVLEASRNANLGPLPGGIVVALVAAFYAALVYIAVFTPDEQGELAFGDVHV